MTAIRTGTNSERSFNEALARVLRTKNPRWRHDLTAEQHRAVRGGGMPDLIVRNSRGAPVVVETEYLPARTVEQDAIQRLGRILAGSGAAIEQCVALRAPEALREAPQAELDAAVAEAAYEYCLFSSGANDGEHVRWPSAGWITGDVDDLATVLESAAISERVVAYSLDVLEQGIGTAALQVREATADRPDVNARVAEALHQEDGEQTSRMAMAIIANALTFQTMLAGVHGIRTLDELRRSGALPKAPVLREWERILEINYWPIFHVAREVLLPIPDGPAARVLGTLADVSSELEAHGVTQSHDIYGRTFQRLISDRKFLATFYTLPASATLLAELAVSLMFVDWSDREEITGLRACDFACGTGTLITAAYHAMLARYRRTGGDDAEIHRTMMEQAIFAADIMPAATHLTTSMLSSAHPTTPFERTQVHLLPYGRQEGDASAEYALGALDLIGKQHGTGLFENTGIERHHGTGESRGVMHEGEGWSKTFLLEHKSMDLVIMNPPFTRPTNHEATDVPVPSFAGLGNDADEQGAMSNLLKTIRKQVKSPAGHGNAGLASNFLDLAHAKVRPGGTLAMVMPLSLLQGASWQASRDLLRSNYARAVVIGLASPGRDDAKSFSADTGMGEVLVVACHRRDSSASAAAEPRVTFVALRKRPTSALEAVGLVAAIRDADVYDTSRVTLGDDLCGVRVRETWDDGNCASIVHSELVDAVRGLHAGALRLPRTNQSFALETTTLSELGTRGLLHRDINGTEKPARAVNWGDATSTDAFRGPFDVVAVQSAAATFPVLWAHAADRERCLIVQPDGEGRVRDQAAAKAAKVWETATRLHLTLDFRLNSQSLAACLTPVSALGGRAWPNFLMTERRHETVAVLWTNTTLGLILFWWAGKVQQTGRACLTISQLPDLHVLDPRTLTKAQNARAQEIFDAFKARLLLPANEAYRDETRQALDRAVLVDLLGLPEAVLEPLAVLRTQWCCEPTVHGGKATRPDAQAGAGLVTGPAQTARPLLRTV